MRSRLPLLLLAVAAFAQPGRLGIFTNSGDVGQPAIVGSTVFDAAKSEYRITGAGANMWDRVDQFQFAWREISGNFTVKATMRFLGQGVPHRKAGIVLRQTTAADSPYIDLVIHGDGMPAMQWRNFKGDVTNAADFPSSGPGLFKLKLVRQGGTITVFVGKDGAEPTEVAHTLIQLGNPLLVGLGVCSHKADASDTAVFSDVSIEPASKP